MSEKLTQLIITNPIITNTNTDIMYFVQGGASAAMTFENFAAQFVLAGTEVTPTQVQSEAFNTGTDTGTSNAYVVNDISPTITSLYDGLIVRFTPSSTNGIGNPTLNVATTGNNQVFLLGQVPLAIDDILGGELAVCMWNATDSYWILLNPYASYTANYLVSNGTYFYSTDSSVGANVYEANINYPQISLDGYAPAPIIILSDVNFSNTGPSTLDLNSFGGINIVTPDGNSLVGGEILQHFMYLFIADPVNNRWILFNSSNASGGTSPWTAGSGTGSAIGGDGSNTAAGNQSLAWGTSTNAATGNVAILFGSGNTSIGHNTFGAGSANSLGTDASRNNIFAIGTNNDIFYQNSFAIGLSNVLALAAQTMAIGGNLTPQNDGSVLIGDLIGNHANSLDTSGQQVVLTGGNGILIYTNNNNNGGTLSAQFLSSGSMILGTNTNDSASAGYVGEFIDSVVSYASAISLTTSTAANVTSIDLTAGDWDVWGNVWFAATGGAITAEACWSNSTSATMPDQSLTTGYDLTTAANGISIPYHRYSLATTTTIFLSASATFAAGSATACGGIYARRVR